MKPVVEFADTVLLKLVRQLVDGDLDPTPDDFRLMRQTFREMEGSWEKIVLGDPEMVSKLKDVVKVWGEQRNQG